MKLYKLVTLVFIFLYSSAISQAKVPAMFRWQDKQAKKHVKKYLHHDTLIQTSEATLHITYNNDTAKPYLMLLHGMGANARSNWYNQIKPLSKGYNLIMPDLIYFGESTSSTQNVSVEFQAKQIHEAILKLGITSKINVMGFSYGGLTTAIYNELFHDQVNKLIIIDGPVKFFSGEMADSLAKSVGVKNMNNIIVPTTIQEFDGMQKAVMSSPFPMTKKLKRKIIAHFFEPTKEIRNKQMNYLIEHQTTYQNYTYNLDKTPTLLIWGGKDGVVPLSVGVSLNKAFPNTTKLIIYPKAKHDSHFSETKKLNKAVIQFINQ
jgi:pimeloyl-ACP methyl ester carboxylesterase